MGESKHTPGPWRVNENGVLWVEQEVGDRVICDPPGVSIGGEPEPVDFANCRLIAASPDLLEAALDAEDFLFNLPGEADEERRELLAKLRAAISKAGVKVADTSQAEAP